LYPHVAQVFIDGGYSRMLAREIGGPLVHPRKLADVLVESTQVQTWAFNPTQHPNAFLGRVAYYDAIPEDLAKRAEVEDYWRAVELLNDVHLGFGALRGLKRNMRQKGVDTLMAVDMLVGAFSGVFDIAVLVAGDADFVPVVEEMKRRGVMVTVAGFSASVSEDLRRAADRFIEVQPNASGLPPLNVAGKTWSA
jgi:uncharacterized LabA/DUF88 family protein